MTEHTLAADPTHSWRNPLCRLASRIDPSDTVHFQCVETAFRYRVLT